MAKQQMFNCTNRLWELTQQGGIPFVQAQIIARQETGTQAERPRLRRYAGGIDINSLRMDELLSSGDWHTDRDRSGSALS
jgi:hypothetical protein